MYFLNQQAVRDTLRPYVGQDVDTMDFSSQCGKSAHLIECVYLSREYPKMYTYLNTLLLKYSPKELNDINIIHLILKNNYFGIDRKLILMFVNAGADINAIDFNGYTILGRIINSNINFDLMFELINTYVSCGGDINIKIYDHSKKIYFTPLMYFLRTDYMHKRISLLGSVRIIERLIGFGATYDSTDHALIEKFVENYSDELNAYIDSLSGKLSKPVKMN